MSTKPSIADQIANLQAEQQKIAADAQQQIAAHEAAKHSVAENANLEIGRRLGMIEVLRTMLPAEPTQELATEAAQPDDDNTDESPTV